jgi:rubrerythrin
MSRISDACGPYESLEQFAGGDATCRHDSLSGDEGPVRELGRMPVRWRCDECDAIVYDDVNTLADCPRCNHPSHMDDCTCGCERP